MWEFSLCNAIFALNFIYFYKGKTVIYAFLTDVLLFLSFVSIFWKTILLFYLAVFLFNQSVSRNTDVELMSTPTSPRLSKVSLNCFSAHRAHVLEPLWDAPHYCRLFAQDLTLALFLPTYPGFSADPSARLRLQLLCSQDLVSVDSPVLVHSCTPQPWSAPETTAPLYPLISKRSEFIFIWTNMSVLDGRANAVCSALDFFSL